MTGLEYIRRRDLHPFWDESRDPNREDVADAYENGKADGYNEGYDAGARRADSHPRWISVEDELPPENDIVLTANDRGGISMGYYCDDDWHNIMFTDREQAIPITHWLQLPEPPK